MQQFLGELLGGLGQARPAAGPAQDQQAEDGLRRPRVQRGAPLFGSGKEGVHVEGKGRDGGGHPGSLGARRGRHSWSAFFYVYRVELPSGAGVGPRIPVVRTKDVGVGLWVLGGGGRGWACVGWWGGHLGLLIWCFVACSDCEAARNA